jgi:hypothetical protein
MHAVVVETNKVGSRVFITVRNGAAISITRSIELRACGGDG